MNELEELKRNYPADMWRLRSLKSLFPRQGNPAMKLLLYEVEQIQKYVTAPIATKLVQASQQVATRPTTPSFTPVPIKIEEDDEAGCTVITKIPEKPPVPIIVLTTPGGVVVSAENMPLWRKIELPFQYRLSKRQGNSNKWLSPALCRRLRKQSRRRQMLSEKQDVSDPQKAIELPSLDPSLKAEDAQRQ
ncbi:unnamed protein product [Clonostachys rosea]|uniref:Uncharacterized protein n=1 Tax=Bionectria ochroleuca TaxID=29856 RepID=A0ABY6UWT0_BIOOC|nr:unnamed protein product [Clonostachys rosea]